MARIVARVTVDRPVEEVFAYLMDSSRWPEWERGLLAVEKTSEGAMDVGTTFRGANRAMGRRMEWTSEVTEHEPGRRWGQRIVSKGWSTEESLDFEPTEGGTRVTLVSELSMGGLMGLVSPILVRMIERQIRDNLARMRDILEG